MAFIIGAGVAGTLIALPYTGLAYLKIILPKLRDIYVPFFLLPIVWGFWNLLYIRLGRPFDIGAWGAILGFIVGVAANIFLFANGQWLSAVLVVLLVGLVLYAILWVLFVEPLNAELSPLSTNHTG